MEAIKELLYKMADDELIIGHRSSEWTGLGPTLEEDISFSSMAQDKIGHALALYTILHEKLGEPEPDTIAFLRSASEFKCCQLAELPNGEYDFSLIRHFLFDSAERIRYEMLSESSFEPVSLLAKKVKGELKYHIFHAGTWVKQLGNGNEESKARLQGALKEAIPYALGIFEPGPFEAELAKENIFPGEKTLQEKWLDYITPVIKEAGLSLPDLNAINPIYGGRKGKHTEHLQPLLDEMSEVIKTDPATHW